MLNEAPGKQGFKPPQNVHLALFDRMTEKLAGHYYNIQSETEIFEIEDAQIQLQNLVNKTSILTKEKLKE